MSTIETIKTTASLKIVLAAMRAYHQQTENHACKLSQGADNTWIVEIVALEGEDETPAVQTLPALNPKYTYPKLSSVHTKRRATKVATRTKIAKQQTQIKKANATRKSNADRPRWR